MVRRSTGPPFHLQRVAVDGASQVIEARAPKDTLNLGKVGVPVTMKRDLIGVARALSETSKLPSWSGESFGYLIQQTYTKNVQTTPSGMIAEEIRFSRTLRLPVRSIQSSVTRGIVMHMPPKLISVHAMSSGSTLVSSSVVGTAEATAKTVARAVMTRRAENIVQSTEV